MTVHISSCLASPFPFPFETAIPIPTEDIIILTLLGQDHAPEPNQVFYLSRFPLLQFQYPFTLSSWLPHYRENLD